MGSSCPKYRLSQCFPSIGLLHFHSNHKYEIFLLQILPNNGFIACQYFPSIGFLHSHACPRYGIFLSQILTNNGFILCQYFPHTGFIHSHPNPNDGFVHIGNQNSHTSIHTMWFSFPWLEYVNEWVAISVV